MGKEGGGPFLCLPHHWKILKKALNTGGCGSATAQTGNYIQATFALPVYVTSVTLAGGFIPSGDHVIQNGYGKLNLQHSTVGKKLTTVIALDI